MESAVTKFSSVFSTQFEIIENIIRSMDPKDLNKAALVCKSWRAVVLKIKKENTRLLLTILQPPREYGTENIFNGCVNKEHLPQACITFIHKEVYDTYSRHLSETQPCTKIQSKLQECIPCPKILVSTDLCISDQLKCFTYCYFVAPNPPLEHVYLTLSLPYMRNSNVEVFEMEFGDKTVVTLKSKLMIENLKCVFLFYDQSKYDFETTLKSAWNDIVDVNPGVNLCIIDSESICDSNMLTCAVFSGKNVLVSSVTVPESANENVKEYTSKLNVPKCAKQSIAFMFSGIKRMNIYENDVLEFQKQFPRIEIIGMKCRTTTTCTCSVTFHKYSIPCNQIFLISWV